MDASTEILIQRVLDGEATPDERAALDARAAEDPAVQAERADLEATLELLGRIEAVPPPADLKRRIMASLPQERYASAPARAEPASGWSFATLVEALREALTARPAFGYAYAAALGAVLGVAAYAAIFASTTPPAPPEVYGTIVVPDAAPPTGEAHAVEFEGGGATARLAHDGARLVLDLDLRTQDAVEVGLAFDPDAVQWSSLTRLDGADGTLTTRGGEVRLALSGPARYRFVFEPDDPAPSLTLSLSRGGETLYEQSLAVAPAGGERKN